VFPNMQALKIAATETTFEKSVPKAALYILA
jgi:hypothetical protein